MRFPDLLTPAEKRLALLLFFLAATGGVAQLSRRLSPPVAAWLDSLEVGPAPAPAPATPAEKDASAREEPITLRDRAAPAAPTLPSILDPNRASAEALTTLPGIGPALAARIVEDRERNGPFRGVEDLLRVKGIGNATLSRIRSRLRVE